MKMLVCSIGSKNCRTTVGFSGLVAQAVAAEVTILGLVGNKRDADRLARILDKTQETLAATGLGVHVRVEVGSAEALVLEEMERTDYDIVAVGALGNKRSRKSPLSSIAARIIDRAPGSVLIVRGSRSELKKILICASGAEQGHVAVRAGAAVACGAGAEATILHVVDAMPAMYAGLERMEETLAELLQTDSERSRELKWAANTVGGECDVCELKLRRGIAVEEILSEGQAGDYDLIVAGSSRAAGGLVRVLMGDLSRELLARAQRPVLVVGSQE